MKHQHAEFIKAWADDSRSVQHRDNPTWPWVHFNNVDAFEMPGEFRMTPRPKYWYVSVATNGMVADISQLFPVRNAHNNIRLTYIDGKLTAAEVITENDGK